jgi:hypothetical protein
MSIWNKVLIGLIIVASLGFFYMALRTLKTHQNWRQKAHQHQVKIEQVREESRRLVEGTGENEAYQPGIERLGLDLAKVLVDRGRVWRDCKPQAGQQTAQTGLVSVATDPRGIAPKTVLYVFEGTDVQKGGRYVGEFKAVKVDEANKLLELAPSMQMTPAELQRLTASAAGKAPWIVYEVMPVDGRWVFAQVDKDEEARKKHEENLRSLFPAQIAEEYLKDGQLLTSEEVEKLGLRGKLVAVDESGRVTYVDQDGKILYAAGVDEKGRLKYVDQKGQFVCATAVQKKVDANGEAVYEVQYLDESGQALSGRSVIEKEAEAGKGKYLRPLRDYRVLLTQCRLQRTQREVEKENAARDLVYVRDAVAKAGEQEKSLDREKTLLTAEREKALYERAAVDGLLQKLRSEVQGYQGTIQGLISENIKTAADLDRIQQDAKRRIDERTGRMAQSGGGETR